MPWLYFTAPERANWAGTTLVLLSLISEKIHFTELVKPWFSSTRKKNFLLLHKIIQIIKACSSQFVKTYLWFCTLAFFFLTLSCIISCLYFLKHQASSDCGKSWNNVDREQNHIVPKIHVGDQSLPTKQFTDFCTQKRRMKLLNSALRGNFSQWKIPFTQLPHPVSSEVLTSACHEIPRKIKYRPLLWRSGPRIKVA